MLSRVHCRSIVPAFLFAFIASATCHAFPAMLPDGSWATGVNRSDVILASEKGKCIHRCRIVREECAQDQANLSRPDDECWDTYDACRANCGDDQQGGTPPNNPVAQGPDNVVLNPTIIGVGKWAEGIAFDGSWLWVAESGQRTIARVDVYGGNVVDRARVGRLPVDMVSNGDGNVYALVHTDKVIWRQSAQRGGGILARLSECPESMTSSGWNLWVLTLPNCSSESSRLIRVDLRNGQQAPSQALGEWGQALVAYDNMIWVAHARAPAITVVDQNSLGSWTLNVGNLSFWTIAASASHVYAGGNEDGGSRQGVVVMFDPRAQQELFRTNLPERIAEIVADETHVVAVGDQGTVYVLSAQNLELQRIITLTTGAFEPRAVMFHDDALLFSNSTYSGEQGAVFMVHDWRPDNRPTTTAPRPNCQQLQHPTDQAVCASSQLMALDEEMNAEFVLALINTTSAAVGGTIDDAIALHKEQRNWQRERDQCGTDVGCLTSQYQSRLSYVRDLNQP